MSAYIVIGALFGTIVAQWLVIRRLSKRITSMLATLTSANDSNEQLLDMLRRRNALDIERRDTWPGYISEDAWLLEQYRDEDADRGDR